jgi:hypothetical protein
MRLFVILVISWSSKLCLANLALKLGMPKVHVCQGFVTQIFTINFSADLTWQRTNPGEIFGVLPKMTEKQRMIGEGAAAQRAIVDRGYPHWTLGTLNRKMPRGSHGAQLFAAEIALG